MLTKKSVAYSLFRRAKNFCLNEDKEDEDKFIFSQLKKNGYPYNFIRKCFLKVNNEETSDVQRPTESKYISMPYIQGATEKIARILKPFNIFLGTKNTNTVGSKVSFSKDRVEKDDKNSVVYKVPCRDCSSSYIGETGRELKVRIREHISNVRNNISNSQIAQHTHEHNHTMNWNNTSILSQHKHNRSRRILEACHTLTTQNTLNRAIEIPDCYTNIASLVLDR